MARRLIPRMIALVVVLCCFCSVEGSCGTLERPSVTPIPNWLLSPWELLMSLWDAVFRPDDALPPECDDLIRFHSTDFPNPITHVEIPQHPFMASNGGNNMHCDGHMSDTYEAAGPIGVNTRVTSRTQGFGGYGTIAYDSSGRLVAVFSNGKGFQLELMDPYSLEELASHDLPPRPWYWFLQGIMPWEYIGAGMYFFLDHQDRAIVPTTKNTVQVVVVPESGGEFELIREYDLNNYVVPMRWPHRDSVAWVLPDWSGAYYWYATTGGMVGTLNVATGEVQTLRLEGEIIENSFAVAEDGAYILSDHALYRFSQDGTGAITAEWRAEYDRGPGKKPGHITRGSGTSVSLAGGSNGLAVITDNAEPRISLLFVRRCDGAVVCNIPVFGEGKSGTDISTACFEHTNEAGKRTGVYSVIVENNWGRHTFPRSRPRPGLTRVDVTRHDNGTYSAEEIWTSNEKSICVFKLSLGSGLVYTYWRSESCPITQWYFTAVDFATGQSVYKKRVGTGLGYNNWAGALFLHPDGGIAYSTTIFGLVMIRDAAP